MIDINLLRADPEKVKNKLKIKNYDLNTELFNEIDLNKVSKFQVDNEEVFKIISRR